MANKQVIFDQDVRSALKRGVDIVANAVKVTIGPRGRNVALERSWGGPVITNDGVSIAKEITLSNKFENMGAQIVKEVATKTNDKAGDGTTTAVVLTQAIIHEGLKRTALGANAVTSPLPSTNCCHGSSIASTAAIRQPTTMRKKSRCDVGVTSSFADSRCSLSARTSRTGVVGVAIVRPPVRRGRVPQRV